MHSQTLYATALIGLASAASFDMGSGHSKVTRVPNERFTGRNGPRALAHAYRKHNMPIPPALSKVLETAPSYINSKTIGRGLRRLGARAANSTSSSDQDGTVVATPEENDSEWLCPVSIGGQTLNLDFDTGSADLWVYDSGLPDNVKQGHSVYDASKSSTYKAIDGGSFKISYGDGSGASGSVGTDTVVIGGVTVDGQAVEQASTISGQLSEDTNNDGLVGLAFSSINAATPQQKTFFDNVQDSLAQPVFAANLKSSGPGSYEFGGIDSSAFSGDLTWVPVDNSQGFWEFNTESFSVGGGPAQQGTSGATAIADTGTTLLLADQAIVDAYYGQVDGAKYDDQNGGYTFDCSAQLPDLSVAIGDSYQAKISGSDLNFAPTTDGGSTCFGALQTSTQGLGVYGDILFRSEYVVFAANSSIGLAPHA